MENGVQYEVINKVTGESFLAKQVAFDEGRVIVTCDAGDIVFLHNNDGMWMNDQFVARDAETKLAPNGVDTVEDVVISEPVAEVVEEVTAEATPEGEVAA